MERILTTSIKQITSPVGWLYWQSVENPVLLLMAMIFFLSMLLQFPAVQHFLPSLISAQNLADVTGNLG